MTFKNILIALFGLLTLAGCSKINEPKPLTYTQLLTGTEKKTWSLVSFEVIDEKKPSGPIPAEELFDNACEADDQFVFYANAEHKYEFTNGPLKCASGEPDILLTDTWSFVNATATLEFAFPVLTSRRELYTVKNLTNSSMTLEVYLDDLDASYRFVFASATK